MLCFYHKTILQSEMKLDVKEMPAFVILII